jgi:hypothetical protein
MQFDAGTVPYFLSNAIKCCGSEDVLILITKENRGMKACCRFWHDFQEA